MMLNNGLVNQLRQRTHAGWTAWPAKLAARLTLTTKPAWKLLFLAGLF